MYSIREMEHSGVRGQKLEVSFKKVAALSMGLTMPAICRRPKHSVAKVLTLRPYSKAYWGEAAVECETGKRRPLKVAD
jgi:hypothetical protein